VGPGSDLELCCPLPLICTTSMRFTATSPLSGNVPCREEETQGRAEGTGVQE